MRLCFLILGLIAFSPFAALGQIDTGVESASGEVELDLTIDNAPQRVDLQSNKVVSADLIARKGEEALARGEYADAASLFAAACRNNNLDFCHRALDIVDRQSNTELPSEVHKIVGLMACRAGVQPGCDRLKAYLVEADTGCAAGDANACVEAGMVRLSGVGTMQEPTRGIENYGRACELGHLDACQNYGQLIASGSILPADPDAALAAFEQSCADTHAHNCAFAGWRYAFDDFEFQDLALATEFYEKGCNYGDAFACAELTRLTP